MDNKRVRATSVMVATAAALALLYFLRGIIVPLIVALVLIVLVQALVRAISNQWRIMPDWLVSFFAALIIVLTLAVAIYLLVQGATQLVEQAPSLINRVDTLLMHASGAFDLEQPLQVSMFTGEVSLPQLAGSVLASVQGLFSSLVLVILYFVFLLAERRRVATKVHNIAETTAQSAVILRSLKQVSQDIETYVWVQTVTGLMIAGGSGLVMLLVGLDNALIWTFVLFLLSFIPILGVTIGSVAPALFALLQFPTLWQALAVFAGIQFVAFIVGNLIYPKMQADTQNISPVATLVSLAFWSALWGMPGAFLSVPLTLFFMLICAKFDSTRWVAVILSNDGAPFTPPAPPFPSEANGQ